MRRGLASPAGAVRLAAPATLEGRFYGPPIRTHLLLRAAPHPAEANTQAKTIGQSKGACLREPQKLHRITLLPDTLLDAGTDHDFACFGGFRT